MFASALYNVLSIVGAVGGIGGVGGALISWRVYRRDRPKLAFNYSVSVRPNGEVATLDVVLVNDGRQPISLDSVQVADAKATSRLDRLLAVRWLAPGLGDRFVYSDERHSLPPTTGLMGRTVLGPGDSAEFGFPIERLVELRAHSLYLLAKDALGREVCEPLAAFVTEAVAHARETQSSTNAV